MDNLNSEVPPLQNFPQPEKYNGNKNLIIILIVVIAILLIALGALAGFFFFQQQNQQPVIVSQNNPATSTNNNLPDQNNVSTTTTSTPETSQDIIWNDPQQIPSLNIFTKTIESNYTYDPEKDAKYYKVGTVTSGKYQGGEIILVSAPADGPSPYPEFYRFIKLADSLIYLKNSSGIAFAYLEATSSKYTTDENYIINQLIFPKSIVGPKSSEILELDQYVNALFASSSLKKVFTDPKYGDVYTSVGYDPNNTDLFKRNGFYIKSPDGTVKVYSLKPDFVDQTKGTQITWLDGTANKADYTYTTHTGCGSANYASILPSNMASLNNMKVTGKTINGDNIYEFKDINNPVLKDTYTNKYQVYGDVVKVPYAEFVANHPVFFWQDPFGRLIKFENSAYGTMAECGKPVIYLYPEQAENISVKVEPQGGMTYSDPAYNTGWNVWATTDSQLTELSSGKNYPYLFWEGRGGIYEQPKKGFVIKQSEVHNFLIEKLAKLGLNAKETKDFMEFWEPRMQNSPYYFVTFLGTEAMNQLAPLTINPKPDKVIRILMDFSPLQKPISVEGYNIKTPTRNGFTVIEWGGVLR